MFIFLAFPLVYAETILFHDDFESYAIGTFPSAGGWFIRPGAPGVGDWAQYITNERAHSGMNSFRLESSQWLGINVHRLFSPPSNKVAIEVFVNTTRNDSKNAFVGFGTQDNVYAAVQLRRNGIIFGRTEANEAIPLKDAYYDANRWIKLRVEADLDTDKFNVLVNDVLVGQNLPAVRPAIGAPIERLIIAVNNNLGDTGGTVAFFDDVKVFEIPKVKEVTIDIKPDSYPNM
jgi:hypothetical protein